MGQDWLYQPAKRGEPATLLGRTAGSWVKILLFYAVYYSFLFCLFYAFTFKWYQGTLPAANTGKKSFVNTRVDQPGAAVYPLAMTEYIKDHKESARPLEITLGSTSSKSVLSKDDYVTALEVHFQKKRDLNKKGTNCRQHGGATEDSKQLTCLVTPPPSKADIEAKIKENKPMVVVELNKKIDWKPIHRANKNNVNVRCYQWDLKNGVKPEPKDQEFTFEFWGQTKKHGELKHFNFPFNGVRETDDAGVAINTYNKPYVAFYIVKKDGKWDSKKYYDFRCEMIADNLSRPTPDCKDDYCGDLVKADVGIAQFGFKME